MSSPAVTPNVDYNALAQQSGAIASTPAPVTPGPNSAALSGNGAQPNGAPNYDAIAAQNGAINAGPPDQTGQVTNDVGNQVIVPKDGESFQDTVKRATNRVQSLTPQQRQQEIDKETATIPAKTAETLGTAAAIGPAMLAPVAGVSEALPPVLVHTIEGAKALGTWAEANPYKAFILYQLAKEFLPGAKKAIGLVKSAPSGD